MPINYYHNDLAYRCVFWLVIFFLFLLVLAFEFFYIATLGKALG